MSEFHRYHHILSGWQRGALLLVAAGAFGLGHWLLGIVLVGFVFLDWATFR